MKNFVLTYMCAFSFYLVNAQTTFTNSDGPLSMDGTNCGSYGLCNNDNCSGTVATIDEFSITISGASSAARISNICFELSGQSGSSTFDLNRVYLRSPSGLQIDLFLGSCIGGVGLGIGCFLTDYVGELCFESGATAQPVTSAGTYETDGSDGLSFSDIQNEEVNGDWSIVVLGSECANEFDPAVFESWSITIDETLSLDSQNQNLFSVYPNPVTDRLYMELQGGDSVKSARLFSLDGRQMYAGTDAVIDLSDFASGLYILKMESSMGTLTQRILKE
jgi:hypothetical protein